MGHGNAVVGFARFPARGQVKTRLARTVGGAAALDIYRGCLRDLDTALEDPRWSFFWAYTPPGAPFSREVAPGRCLFPQAEGDLGERMGRAFERLFGEGFDRVAIVGSDLPHLSPESVADTFRRLDSGADLVLGPAEDGGYYLIAAKTEPPVLTGVSWGDSEVLEQTLDRARARGLSVELLAVDFDLDTERDARRLAALLDAEPERAPRTKRALERALEGP